MLMSSSATIKVGFASWDPHRQMTFAVPGGKFCVLPRTDFLNPSVLSAVIPASGLFHNSVLVATPSDSCFPALVTVSKVLKLMTLLVVMIVLTRVRADSKNSIVCGKGTSLTKGYLI